MKKTPLFIKIALIISLFLIPQASADGTGGTITTDGLYTIHTFLTNGSFIWSGDNQNISLLIIAGGGAGGGIGGGGGAGGLIYFDSNYSIIAGNYSVIVGSGGIGALSASYSGNGSNSSFGNISSMGGGAGANNDIVSVGSGGSGGGGSAAKLVGGSGIDGQGYSGGLASSVSPYKIGGGGGAGSQGYNYSAGSGDGGYGMNISITGDVVCYAGGGGGGARGDLGGNSGAGRCGGGNGTNNNNAGGNGTNGLGGGGGGAGRSASPGGIGGSGGSGIIIIRYLNTSSSPFVSFVSPTPENNSIQYQPENNTIKTSVTINNQTGLNSTIRLYLEGTGLINSTPNSTSFNFTSLGAGTYYINASLINSDGSTNTSTDTRRIDLYTINNTINTPAVGENITRYINMTFTSNATSSLVNISTQKIFLNGSSLANLTGINNSFNYDTYTQNYTIGTYNLSMNITDNQGKSIQNNILINFATNKQLNLTVFSAIDSSKIQNFSINITDLNTGNSRNYPLNNGSVLIDTIKLGNYTVTIDSPGYAITTQNISLDNQTFQDMNLSIYTENSINIHIYDETTNLLILENITIVFTQGFTQITNTTTTGSYYQEGLADGSWTIKFTGTNYSLKTYTVTVANRSTQNLNAYLSSISLYSIFTIMDFDSGALIEGASFTQSKLINGSWTIINSKLSDITGRVQFDYIPNAKYEFLISMTGYQNNLFYLDPVLFSTYNIRLTKTTTLSLGNTPDNLGVYITFYNNATGDTTWNNLANNNLIWIINSPIGNLEAYNLTLQIPGSNLTQTGILATGEQFNQNFTLNSSDPNDQVIINYCYESSTSYPKCFRFPYNINGVYLNTSMIANKDTTYGLGVFERVLIITIAVLFCVGTIFIFGGAIPGLIVALLIYGFALSTGFVTIWMIFPSLFIGFIMIVSTKGGQY